MAAGMISTQAQEKFKDAFDSSWALLWLDTGGRGGGRQVKRDPSGIQNRSEGISLQ